MQFFEQLFLRHAHRPPFEQSSWGHNVSITPEGKCASTSLGKHLTSNKLSYCIWSSPIKRCVETAEAISRGVGSNKAVKKSSLLGDPGFFIQNPQQAATFFKKYSLPNVIDLYLQEKSLPGFFSVETGCQRMLSVLLEKNASASIWVTHDICVAILACFLFKQTSCKALMPNFLEGIMIKKNKRGWLVSYRGSNTRIEDGVFRGKTACKENFA